MRAWAGHRAVAAQALLRALAGVAAVSSQGCQRSVQVGDHVYVEWEGKEYPAFIKEATSPAKFKVHFDGYDDSWDQVVTKDRIKRPVEGAPVHPEPPPKVRAKAMKAVQTNQYKTGDRVRVEWHGVVYPAIVTGIVGTERYRVHYEGYGPEFDENVGLSRIQPR
jgi:hypothetical protein